MDKEKCKLSPRKSRKEIIRINKTELNKIENRKTIKKINGTKSWFFKNINKIDKSLARLKRNKGRGLKLLKL